MKLTYPDSDSDFLMVYRQKPICFQWIKKEEEERLEITAIIYPNNFLIGDCCIDLFPYSALHLDNNALI